ncbi:sulfur carrier protein CysO [Gordonia araii NBRC 100433]|uniref:Sulfur carrier protein CysO n=1 Tax=Gordonia araii NBRC 100433 TaxID=1073574 RepID=G7GX14_9ACTN|nr:MoaD/ThiS family protein [Gordonia araii]NNG99158.1 MoaD/ThiS family protein [Gordonia araii NBRC 100433]GAB08139.1 sulfur carrier protein CysO [Gordonia araii NBRC 100433]
MAVSVSIPTILRPHTDGAKKVQATGTTLAEVIADLESNFPGLAGRLRDDDGALLRFVNIYVNDEDVRFTGGADTAISDGDDVTVLPAVAGGDRSATVAGG